MDRLWEAVMTNRWRPFQFFGQAKPLPAMDVFEKDGAFHVRAELPGMTDKEVEVTATADTLTITGEKKEEREVKEENYYRTERSYGKFSRQIALPAGADTGQATARFKDGVLEIDIPIKAVESGKKIEIGAGQ
jgi:HSP20 family protein